MSVPIFPTPSAVQHEVESLAREEELTPWETAFARYDAFHPRMSLEKQAGIATRLAGTLISKSEVRQLRYKPLFQDLWLSERGKHDREKKMAEARVVKMMPKAARIANKMLDKVEHELDTGDEMGAVRAGTPLISEFLGRISPKKQEGNSAAIVVINLTAAQSASLNQPERIVLAEEVEIVHDEEMGT